MEKALDKSITIQYIIQGETKNGEWSSKPIYAEDVFVGMGVVDGWNKILNKTENKAAMLGWCNK